jgi:hypothetical protein
MTNNEQQEIGAFDLPSFCHAYKISRSLAYKEIRAGRLKIFKVGTLTRITPEAAREWQRSLASTKEPA